MGYSPGGTKTQIRLSDWAHTHFQDKAKINNLLNLKNKTGNPSFRFGCCLLRKTFWNWKHPKPVPQQWSNFLSMEGLQTRFFIHKNGTWSPIVTRKEEFSTNLCFSRAGGLGLVSEKRKLILNTHSCQGMFSAGDSGQFIECPYTLNVDTMITSLPKEMGTLSPRVDLTWRRNAAAIGEAGIQPRLCGSETTQSRLGLEPSVLGLDSPGVRI